MLKSSQPKTELYAGLIQPYTRFSLKLFQEILQGTPDKNVIVSPVSAAIALVMCYNGAVGDTSEAIAKTLNVNHLSLDALNKANAALLDDMQHPDPQVTLTLENRISADSNTPWNAARLADLQKIYQAVLDNDGSSASIRLTNKIQFRGIWTTPFEPASTYDGLFHLPALMAKPCPMMSSNLKDWHYFQHDDFQMVRLPYGDERISLIILLPDEDMPMWGIMSQLSPETLTAWTGRLESKKGTIDLPRFNAAYEIRLNDILRRMGMEVAFDPAQANFSGLSTVPAWIDKVEQRAKIEVDETGTVAEAKTLIEIELGFFGLDETAFHMQVNRPFLYWIQDDISSLPLFFGYTVDPVLKVAAVPLSAFAPKEPEPPTLNELADALDEMTTAMDNDMGFDQAIGKVYEQWDNTLALGFGRALREMQLGKRRSDALKDMSVRMNMPELTAFITAAIQADIDGVAIIRIMRAHAAQVRAKLNNM